MNRLQLIKRRDTAITSLASASSDPEKKKATLELEAASAALAIFDSKKETVEKHEKHEVHKTEEDDEPKKPLEEDDAEDKDKDKDEDEDEDDDDDDEESSSAEEEEEESASAEEEDDEKAAASEEKEEEEEERAKESALVAAEKTLALAKGSKNAALVESARASVKALKTLSRSGASATRAALRSSVTAITGKKSSRGAAKAVQALAGELVAVKAARKSEKVKSMLQRARVEGRISPAQELSLASKDPSWLKGFLAGSTKGVHTIKDPARVGRTLSGKGNDSKDETPTVDSRVDQAFTLNGLDEGAKKFIVSEAGRLGKSVDDVLASMNARLPGRETMVYGFQSKQI